MVSHGIESRWPNATVLVASSGELGLDVIEKENPHLTILDIGLPGIDGFEVLSAIRSVSDMPVIMLMARGDRTDVVKALDMGADDCMIKPLNQDLLLAKAQYLLRQTVTAA